LKENSGSESSKEQVIFRRNENQEMEFVSTKDGFVLFASKCPHLVFESKQENKHATK
jgi:hypothetical protein